MLFNNKHLSNFYKYKRKLASPQLSAPFQQRRENSLSRKVNKTSLQPLKILFFGTDTFSLPSLKALYKHSAFNLGCVTSFKSPANCVRLFAEQQQLPIYRWPLSAVDICSSYDLGVVVSFGHLIPAPIIKAFPLGMINVHASLLPRWRGAAPIIHAIMQDDKITGVSIMKIEPKHFDIGDILAQKEVPIRQDIMMPELHAELALHGANLLVEVVKDFPTFLRNAKKQTDSDATYAPKVTPSLTKINWTALSAVQLFNRYRALYGFKYLSTQLHDRKVQLIEIKLPEAALFEHSPLIHAEPGSFIYLRDRNSLIVRCAENSLIEVKRLRLESKQVMTAQDFHNGYLKKRKTVEIFSSELNIT